MPVAFYAISFKASASVLAFCTFEKQELADQAAWDKLRDGLVGDQLPIGVSKNAALNVDKLLLAADAVAEPPPSGVMANPLRYQVSGLRIGDTATPGDGKDKKLTLAGDNTVNGNMSAVGATGVVTVNLSNPLPTGAAAWIVFEGASSPIQGVMNAQKTGFTFGTGGALDTNTRYDVLFLMAGTPATYQAVKPT